MSEEINEVAIPGEGIERDAEPEPAETEEERPSSSSTRRPKKFRPELRLLEDNLAV